MISYVRHVLCFGLISCVASDLAEFVGVCAGRMNYRDSWGAERVAANIYVAVAVDRIECVTALQSMHRALEILPTT